MIKFTFCFCALFFLRVAVAAPAASSALSSPESSVASSVVSGTIVASSGVSSAVTASSVVPSSVTTSSIVLSSSVASTIVQEPSSTVIAAEPSATVPVISLDPNEPLIGDLQPIRGTLGAPLLGPTDPEIVEQNPDLLAPPTTDHGSIDNAKWPFSLSHNRLQTGGWARNQNIGQMPLATQLAGVNMRLEAGAVRELHWHSTSEWAYVLKGKTQVTSVDTEGRNFISTVGPGDIWFFPPGIPHSLQGTGDDPEGTEFILVFDDGAFSEDATFLVTDWLSHVPVEVLEKNLRVNASALAGIPAEELYIFPAALPGPDSSGVVSPQGVVPQSFTFPFSQVNATQLSGGSVKVVDTSTFPVAVTTSAAEVVVNPGAIRELHWHPTQDEWSFFIEGTGRMTIFGSQSNARTFDYQAGDIGYVPATFGHYVENTGNTTLRFLEIFKSDKFQDVSLAQVRMII
ncbi:hypothetical protein H2248_008843 [Termitomyces sp. 'cryptogamus']|nr:hypothetical protein H2248_008843 [Termitomyces sp. 'cryptogamus']